jgi:hypothetical protein
MAWLRCLGSALAGFVLASLLFAGMGHATAPAVIYQQTLDAHPRLSQPVTDLVRICDGDGNWDELWHSTHAAPPPPLILPPLREETVAPPGFETEIVVDPAAFRLDLVVLSQRIEIDERSRERRWWETLFQRLAK